METIIEKPSDLSLEQLRQIIKLINDGGQINVEDLKERLLNSDFVAITHKNGTVICTATLKNPLSSYVQRVFNEAKALNNISINKELGYIATHSDYENQGYCKKLLIEFHSCFSKQNIFATTRKPSMVHILGKFGFKIVGQPYKKDLLLLTHLSEL